MTRSPRRIDLALGYVLHHRPWRDTSRILELLTREHGRFTVFAKGVRGPRAKLASALQPFQPLLLSWIGRGEAPQLTGAERAENVGALPAAVLLGAFYMNELLLKLTTRHDPVPELFDQYHASLARLRDGAALEPTLRIFEKRLLEGLGYGLDLATESRSGLPIEAGSYYHFRPAQGLVGAGSVRAGALHGESLVALAQERLSGERALDDARRLLKAALAACLEGRQLATREVARALLRGGAR